MKTSLRLACAVIAITGAVQFLPPPRAFAQAALEEIVVTARKRTENLQDIPLSITTFSAEQLSRSASRSLEDISRQTPGLQFNTSLAGTRPGRLQSNLRFRGFEGNEFSSSTSEVASLYIDGVYALQGAQSVSLMDIERVEVIKGPQSAQFSRKSFAGAINYITSNPNLEEFKAKLEADAATYGQYEVQGSAEGPLVKDKMSMRVSARLYNKGSMYTANDGGQLGKESTKSVSGVFYVTPSDNFSFKARLMYQRDDDGPPADTFLPGRAFDTCTGTSRPGFDDNGKAVTLSPKEYICGAIPNPGQRGAPKVTYNTSLSPGILATPQGAFPAQPDLIRTALLNAPQLAGVPQLDGMGLKRDIVRISGTGTYTFANDITASLTGAYNSNKANDLRDWDMTNNEAWYVNNPQTGTDYSADFRVTSGGKQRFRWLAGASYYKQEFITSGGGGKLVSTCLVACGVLPATVFSLPTDLADIVHTWGIYGAASYDILQNLTLDVEARYQRDKHYDGVSYTQTYNQFLPRVSVSFKPQPGINLYANWSRGKLPGVINTNFINCSAKSYTTPFTDPRTGLPSTSSVCDQYKQALGSSLVLSTPQQTLDAYEIGLKTQFLDGKAQVNVAAYHYKWNNDPFSSFVTVFKENGTTGTPLATPNFDAVSTAGSTKSYGLELETAFVLVEGWTVNANGQWNKNSFINYTVNNAASAAVYGTHNVKGNRSSRYPEWSGSITSTYTRAINDVWQGYVRGDVYWQGRSYSGITNLAYVTPYALVNAHIGIERDKLRVELYVKNMMDQKTWKAASDFTDFSVPGSLDFNHAGNILVPQDRRTFGIKSSIEF